VLHSFRDRPPATRARLSQSQSCLLYCTPSPRIPFRLHVASGFCRICTSSRPAGLGLCRRLLLTTVQSHIHEREVRGWSDMAPRKGPICDATLHFTRTVNAIILWFVRNRATVAIRDASRSGCIARSHANHVGGRNIEKDATGAIGVTDQSRILAGITRPHRRGG
jgi:hypothetical protein